MPPTLRRNPTARWPIGAGVVLVALFLLASTPLYSAPSTGAPHPVAPRGSGQVAALSPTMGPRSAAPHPGASYVDPFLLIQQEPAPMGITDFGVTGASGVVHAYSYATPVFQGNVEIDSMLTQDSTGGHFMTFQLNVVLVLHGGSQNFSYWIQDVASIDSSTRVIGWVDNIWNLSSPTAALANGELQGNGSVNNFPGLSWYADAAGSGYPGNNVILHYPANVSVRAVSSVIGGTPHVAFTYNDGFGWVVFDNVTFPHATGWTDYGFVVDGFQYAPIGIFTDAEWDFSGSGSGQHTITAGLNMSLVYWNGHNFQAPPSAFNFGSDTAETLDNVISALGAPPSNGTLYSRVTNGSGTLHLLYNSSGVGTLRVLSPSLAAGAISVNGSLYPFRGSEADLTIAPGSYDVGLWNGTGFVDSINVTVPAGGTTTVVLPQPTFGVSFQETGLPSGTPWSVTLASTPVPVTGAYANTTLRNGTYDYVVGDVPGYTTPSFHGSVTVAGADRVVPIPFWTFNYTVTFTAYSLPAGTPWSVQFNGGTLTSLASAIVTFVPNGTYTYSVTTVNTFLPQPPSGAVDVLNGPQAVEVDFVLHTGRLAGTISPSSGSVWVNGAAVTLQAGAFNLSELPGTYAVEGTATGYLPAFYNLTVTPGNVTSVTITLTPRPSSGGGASGAATLSNEEAIAVIAGALVVISLVAFVALRRRRRR